MSETPTVLPETVPPRVNPSPRTTGLIVVALLTLIAVLLFASVRQESQTFDEGMHIYAGFEYWKHADFGRNPEHPPLAKLVAAIPLLSMGLKEQPPIPIPFFKAQDLVNSAQFLYTADADAILLRARLMIAIFSLVLAGLVFLAAREMFDTLTALFALGIFAFEPVLLANGALVTTDMPLACFFFASVYAFYRCLRKMSVGRIALCAVMTALTIVSKHSGILILPVLVLLAILDPIFCNSNAAKSEGKRFGRLILALAAIGVFSYLLLWTIYGFRYAARPDQLQMVPTLAAYSSALSHPLQRTLIMFFARHHIFPEAYLFGWVDILLIPDMRPTFLFGHVFGSGQWFFFPVVFLVKTTLTLLVFLLVLPFLRIRGLRREFLVLVVPEVFYMLMAVFSMLNLGIRHILPVYPFCIVLGGAAAAALVSRSRAGQVAVAALSVFAVISSLHSFPDYLAYSNELVGGPAYTYRVVTDSNADWGQGLKWTKAYLDKHPTSDCWFDYVNPVVNPAYYGIHCKPLLSGMGHLFGMGFPLPLTISGTVLLSATEESGLMWGPETLNPYAVFGRLKPDAKIGNVILVYNGTFDVPLLAAQSNASAAVGLLRQRRLPEALALAQNAAQLAPDSAEVNAVLGEVLLASGRIEEGKQAMARAIHLAKTVEPDYQKHLLDYLSAPQG